MKSLTEKDTGTTKFTEALLTTATAGKLTSESNRLATNGARNKGDTYTRECYLSSVYFGNVPFAATWMNPETDTGGIERRKSIYSMTVLYMGIQKEIMPMNIFTKPRQTPNMNSRQISRMNEGCQWE